MKQADAAHVQQLHNVLLISNHTLITLQVFVQ